MAVFDPKIRYSPSDLRYVSSFSIPALDMKQIGDFSEFMFKAQEKKLKDIETNFGKIQDTRDALLGLRFDNARQADVLSAKREQYALTNETFASLNVNDLQNSIYSRTLGGRFKQFMADPDVRLAQQEVVAGDDFRNKIASIKDPILRARAMEKYKQYREKGDIIGLELNPGNYETINLDNELKSAVALAPITEEDEWEKDPDGNFIGVRKVKKRDKDAVDRMIADNVTNNGAFAENMKAKGYMDEDGNVTDKYIQHRDDLIAASLQESSVLGQVHAIPEEKIDGGAGIGEPGDLRNGRFSNKTNDGRAANALDAGLIQRGFELLDPNNTLALASKGALITHLKAEGEYPEGDYVVIFDKDGFPVFRQLLKRASAQVVEKRKNAFVLEPSGPADEVIKSIIINSESLGSGGYKAYNPSEVTGAVGQYQFMLSSHRDAIKNALDSLEIDWRKVKPNPKVNNESGTMKKEDRQLATAFINSPDAQERVWAGWYDTLRKGRKELEAMAQPDDAIKGLSQAELTYILHHVGSVAGARQYIHTGQHPKKDTEKKSPTAELKGTLKKIKNSLDLAGITGEIKEDGTMMPLTSQASTVAAQDRTTATAGSATTPGTTPAPTATPTPKAATAPAPGAKKPPMSPKDAQTVNDL